MSRPSTARARSLGAVVVCVAVLVVVMAGGAAAAPAANPAEVLTDRGPVVGTVAADHRSFTGIPFATPPVGDLRWAPPRDTARWSEPLDARSPSRPCPQPGLDVQDEDCLTVDVTTPAHTNGSLPVLVWLHGGAFFRGSGGSYDPTRMVARSGVIVVTVNYRLGALGFLADDALGADSNFGLQDQVAALRWVQRNAAAFGGDPGNVTAMGGSAGGLSICSHLTSGAAPELFGRAIIQSGPCAAPFRTRTEGQSQAEVFRNQVGCAGPDAAACLRALPVDRLLAAQTSMTWSPTVGDGVVREQPADAFRAGRIAQVDMMIGNTLDEARFSVGARYDGTGTPVTADRYRDTVEQQYGDDADAVLAQYPVGAQPTPSLALAAVNTDYLDSQPPLSVCPTLWAEEDAARVTSVHAYEFADRTAPPRVVIPGFPSGAQHASEVQYLLADADAGTPLNAQQRALGDVMIDYWSSFARTGEPRSEGAPPWPRFRTAAPVRALGARIDTVDLSAEHRCAFWASTVGRR